MHKINNILTFTILLGTCVSLHAAPVYVIDKLEIGLHQQATVDSPIKGLVASGTELEVIEQKEDMLLVKDANGLSGWINRNYTQAEKPGRIQVNILEARNKALSEELNQFKTSSPVITSSGGGEPRIKELEQQLNSERIKSGELQAQLTDLRAHIPGIEKPSDLEQKVQTLQTENKALLEQLSSSGIEPEIKITSDSKLTYLKNNFRTILTYTGISLFIGLALGFFLMDLLNRRRHGGLRL